VLGGQWDTARQDGVCFALLEHATTIDPAADAGPRCCLFGGRGEHASGNANRKQVWGRAWLVRSVFRSMAVAVVAAASRSRCRARSRSSYFRRFEDQETADVRRADRDGDLSSVHDGCADIEACRKDECSAERYGAARCAAGHGPQSPPQAQVEGAQRIAVGVRQDVSTRAG